MSKQNEKKLSSLREGQDFRIDAKDYTLRIKTVEKSSDKVVTYATRTTGTVMHYFEAETVVEWLPKK